MGSRISSPLLVAALVFSSLALGPSSRALAAPVSTTPATATCKVGPGRLLPNAIVLTKP